MRNLKCRQDAMFWVSYFVGRCKLGILYIIEKMIEGDMG